MRRSDLLALLALAILALSACSTPRSGGGDDDDDDEEPTPDETPQLEPLPELADDCAELLNETIDDAMALSPENHTSYPDLQLCSGDVDWYGIDVPPGRWVSVELVIDGSGTGNTDLDLIETDADGEVIWGSQAQLSYERVAFFNPTDQDRRHYLYVAAWALAEANYELIVRRSSFHEGLDCDAFYPDEAPTDPNGSCNRIMQFPRNNFVEDGHFLDHPPVWSSLRRELIYLVREASRRTAEAFEDTNVLGLLDMSERDGATPGFAQGQLRHPEGTHENGNDMDIAYYQTGEDNAGRPVCVNDNYFCTQEPNILDAERSAYFMAQLFESEHVRVIGVDTLIAPMLQDAADVLLDEGMITAEQHQGFYYSMAYGDGWPFHHHHMHFSWDWEGGWEGRDFVEGCMTGPNLY